MAESPRRTPLRALMEPGRVGFVAALLAVAGGFSALAVAGGHRLLLSGHLFPSDLLFGLDIDRVVRAMAQPHFYFDRNVVHPLFRPLTYPFGWTVRRFGISLHTSAILVNTAAGALALLATAWYLRLRGVARLDAWLMTLLMASGATWLFLSALPCVPIFSLLFLALMHVLLAWTQKPSPAAHRREGVERQIMWVVLGVINYGLTITNGMFAFLTYGFSRRERPWWQAWARAVVYGAVVLGIGFALSWWTGDYLAFWGQAHWLGNTTLGGKPSNWPLLESLATSLAWTAVSPIPHIGPTPDPRHWIIAAFTDWRFNAAGWVLVVVWLGLLALAWRAAWRDRDAWRLNGALAACLTFHILFHRWVVFAYEGSFQYNGHSYFMVMGLFASLLVSAGRWPAGRRRALRLVLLLLAAGLAIHNARLLMTIGRLVPIPAGYPTVVR